MESQRRNGNGNYKYSQFCNDYGDDEVDQLTGYYNNSPKVFPFSSSPPRSPQVTVSHAAVGCIHHHVSKFDTLAGVAIKYGVEVADIKKMNGLVTDLQMFAFKSIQIPLPGRHPPSLCLSNGSDTPRQSSSQTPGRAHSDLFDSFHSLRLKTSQQKVSPAMSSLQGNNGLKPTHQNIASESFEMAIYRKGDSNHLEDDQHLKPSPAFNRPLSCHRKSRSLVNGFLDENNGLADMTIAEASVVDSEERKEKLSRNLKKSEADTPEMLLKEDNDNNGVISTITGKGLALRPKAASRTGLSNDFEAGGLTPVPIGMGDYLVTNWHGVRKSSSTSSLHDQGGNNSNSSSIWQWSKPDFQAFSAAGITRPIFDGLPKPITSRRNKAALD